MVVQWSLFWSTGGAMATRFKTQACVKTDDVY